MVRENHKDSSGKIVLDRRSASIQTQAETWWGLEDWLSRVPPACRGVDNGESFGCMGPEAGS